MQCRVLSWNLFHGRDRAPDPGLHTWRSRLLRVSERGGGYAQVNRDLFDSFAEVLAEAEWDIALLQECPPHWAEPLADACRAHCHRVLTARNLPYGAFGLQGLAARINPDLIASWEGGSNLTLMRTAPRGAGIASRRELTLTRSPETRRMAFSRLESGLCVANLHASEDRQAAEREVLEAARTADAWAEGAALIFGGDLNIRADSSRGVFAHLEAELGLAGRTEGRSVDHLLSRGLERGPTTAWEPDRREVPDPTAPAERPALPVRLSDHAPIEFTVSLPDPA